MKVKAAIKNELFIEIRTIDLLVVPLQGKPLWGMSLNSLILSLQISSAYFHRSNSLMTLAGFPASTQCPSGKLLVTIVPAPTMVYGPSVTPGRMTAFMAIQQFSPSTMGLPG